MYGMYPNAEQWRINLSFIALALLGSVGYFATDRFKKYLTLYYVVIYPFIAFLFIFFFISGGPVFFDFSYGIIAAILSIISDPRAGKDIIINNKKIFFIT